MLQVFGRKPENSIYLGDQPYQVRNDCSIGQWKVGDSDLKGKEIEISIIKVSRYFGSLGKAENTLWLQVWFVPAPSCDRLPQNTVCLTYLKSRSVNQFSQKITELMQSGEPALGIFVAGFDKHSNEYGVYYSVTWDWRERQGDEEIKQLELIEAFMKSQPALIDLSATQNMIALDRLSSSEVQALLESRNQKYLQAS